MIEGYYNNMHRIQLLHDTVEQWLGTPFFLNGKTKEGAGCAGGQLGIHCEVGALEMMDIPRGTGGIGDQLAIARMSNWLATRPEFFRVLGWPREGDLITGKTLVGEYHIGTWLGTYKKQQQAFVHTTKRYGMTVSNLLDPTYSEKLVAVWRIKHESELK